MGDALSRPFQMFRVLPQNDGCVFGNIAADEAYKSINTAAGSSVQQEDLDQLTQKFHYF